MMINQNWVSIAAETEKLHSRPEIRNQSQTCRVPADYTLQLYIKLYANGNYTFNHVGIKIKQPERMCFATLHRLTKNLFFFSCIFS